MSLVRVALRIAAVEALKGRTLVDGNVLDSQIGALDVAANGLLHTPQERPFVSVYTDDSKVTNGLELRSFTKSGHVDIVFEAGIATPHVVTDADTDESVIYEGVAATDANFEFHLDLTMRQIADALADPENEWAAIFNSLIRSFEQSQRSRASGDTNGVRLAAHQLKLTVDAVADPVRGVALKDSSPLALFFAKCETDLVSRMPDMARKVALMRAQIAGDANELQAAMRRYGMVFGEADAMLMTPAFEVR
ncbi:hypothetical protein GA0061101_113141 [Rhizobium lusitanum]|uniref:Uncharacterized protein n=1 Tax=Rhizobium lusitanum TaxID=293958 RepID=A0A1C3WMX2_9HYPH|nr:hypothetical protein GA0061101_113141 [Rhizobium lusitanum]